MKYSKYSILILLLLVLVSSKIENKIRSFISVAKSALYEEEGEDEDACTNASTEQCLVTDSLLPNLQCCTVKATLEEPFKDTQEICTTMLNPFKPIANLIKSSKFTYFFKEIFGFFMYGPPDEAAESEIIKVKEEITCNDDKASFSIGYDEYTEEEKNILKSEEYCLYDIYNVFSNLDGYIPKSIKCEDLSVLPNSKANGLECGYFQLSAKDEYQSYTINSCILFNKDFYSQIKMPKEYYSFIKDVSSFYSFTIEIHDAQGNTFNFDSEKEPDDPDEEEEKHEEEEKDEEEDQHEEEGSKDDTPGKSSFISISKFILILIGLF